MPNYRDDIKKLRRKIDPVDQAEIYDSAVSDIIESKPKETTVTSRKRNKKGAKNKAKKDADAGKRNRMPANAQDVHGVNATTYAELVRLAYGRELPDKVRVAPAVREDPDKSIVPARWGAPFHKLKVAWAVFLVDPRRPAGGSRIVAGKKVVRVPPGKVRAPRTPWHKTLREAVEIAHEYAGLDLGDLPPPRRLPTVGEMVTIIEARGDEVPDGLGARIDEALRVQRKRKAAPKDERQPAPEDERRPAPEDERRPAPTLPAASPRGTVATLHAEAERRLGTIEEARARREELRSAEETAARELRAFAEVLRLMGEDVSRYVDDREVQEILDALLPGTEARPRSH